MEFDFSFTVTSAEDCYWRICVLADLAQEFPDAKRDADTAIMTAVTTALPPRPTNVIPFRPCRRIAADITR